METVTIEYQPNFKEELFAILNKLDSNVFKIIENKNDVFEDEAFINHRNFLHSTLKKLILEKAKCIL